MGLTDIFKVKQFKNEIENLQKENEALTNLLTPEMKDAHQLELFVNKLNIEKSSLESEISEYQQQIAKLINEITEKKDKVIELDDKILFQDFALYTPVYNLMNSEKYKDELLVVRDDEKNMIKRDIACSYPTNFTLDGSLSKGKKLVKDNVKQILRSFNNECDAVIDKVKFNNVEAIRKKIQKSYDDLNKMNASMQISLSPRYLELKLKELNLCYEYSQKKQEEKEEQKLIREQMREEAKLQKEIEETRKTIEKEQRHYQNALHQLEQQIVNSNESEREELLSKKDEIEKQLKEIDKSIIDIDYRAANKRAGYVYIISNIGSFGENVYKIGMTRRLEPTERVDELGDASVPFNFDIHAMIFSDDAPALENALHKAFENKKVNMVNQRREFFNVTLEEIEEVVKNNYDRTVEFVKIPVAEQYRESQMLKSNL